MAEKFQPVWTVNSIYEQDRLILQKITQKKQSPSNSLEKIKQEIKKTNKIKTSPKSEKSLEKSSNEQKSNISERTSSLNSIQKEIREWELLKIMKSKNREIFKKFVSEKSGPVRFNDWYSQMDFKDELNKHGKLQLAEARDPKFKSRFSPEINHNSRLLAQNYQINKTLKKFKEKNHLELKIASKLKMIILPIKVFQENEFRLHMTKINGWNNSKKERNFGKIIGNGLDEINQPLKFQKGNLSLQKKTQNKCQVCRVKSHLKIEPEEIKLRSWKNQLTSKEIF